LPDIAPFEGIRYDPEVVGEVGAVVSPPYDVISPSDRLYYHQLHPNNFVRLVLGEEFDTDTDSENRFTRARNCIDSWLASGALRRESRPAIYLYRQRFTVGASARTIHGYICAVRIHDYADRIILPHEKTLAKPKSQLITLIRETAANLDSVYGLYADETHELDTVRDQTTSRQPDTLAHDKDGVEHALWVIDNENVIAVVRDFLAPRQIAIADGHHRYETALNYRDEMRKSRGEGLQSEYILMTLVNVYEKDITVFPTHRVIAGLAPELLGSLDARLAESFVVVPSRRETILEDMRSAGGIGLYRTGSAAVLKPVSSTYSRLPGSEASRNLELNVLHGLILEPILGIGAEKLRNETQVVYTRDSIEAMNMVDSGERQAAFLLNDIPVKSVLDIAAAAELMPQKATYFYPKLLSGLVMRKMG